MENKKQFIHEKLFAMSIEEFEHIFLVESDCISWLATEKWQNGFVCHSCGHTHYCEGQQTGSRRCTKCKKEESIKAHTIFQNCKLPLKTSMHLMLYAYHNPDISSIEMCNKLGIRQMTCWRMKNLVKQFK